MATASIKKRRTGPKRKVVVLEISRREAGALIELLACTKHHSPTDAVFEELYKLYDDLKGQGNWEIHGKSAVNMEFKEF